MNGPIFYTSHIQKTDNLALCLQLPPKTDALPDRPCLERSNKTKDVWGGRANIWLGVWSRTWERQHWRMDFSHFWFSGRLRKMYIHIYIFFSSVFFLLFFITLFRFILAGTIPLRFRICSAEGVRAKTAAWTVEYSKAHQVWNSNKLVQPHVAPLHWIFWSIYTHPPPKNQQKTKKGHAWYIQV